MLGWRENMASRAAPTPSSGTRAMRPSSVARAQAGSSGSREGPQPPPSGMEASLMVKVQRGCACGGVRRGGAGRGGGGGGVRM